MTWSLMDLIILIVLLLGVLHGLVRGIARTLGGIAGLLIGGAAALWVIPQIPLDVADRVVRLLILGGVLVIGMLGGQALGEALVGRIAGAVTVRSRVLRVLDAIGGALIGAAVAALVVLAAVSTLASGPSPALGAHAERSPMMRLIDRAAPQAVVGFLESAQQRVAGSTAARELDTLLFEPAPPPAGDVVAPEIVAAADSTVRVVGFAPQCSARLGGSGFVASPGQAVTNAHVVAGAESVFVHDAQGRRHEAEVVVFDPDADLAVLSVPTLQAPVLEISPTPPPGTMAAFAGHPRGGALEIGAAEVQGTARTAMSSIDDDASSVPVEVLQFAGDVQEGNSGGPLLDGDGEVIGVVFARSSTGSAGFAVTTESLTDALAEASGATRPVPTQECEPADAA